MVGASDPLPIAGHQIHNLVGALNPCSLRSPEALRHRPSAFCLRTSAFPGNTQVELKLNYILESVRIGLKAL